MHSGVWPQSGCVVMSIVLYGVTPYKHGTAKVFSSSVHSGCMCPHSGCVSPHKDNVCCFIGGTPYKHVAPKVVTMVV